MLRPNPFFAAALAFGPCSFNASAATSLDLFSQIPAPPQDERVAIQWWKDGKLGGSELEPLLAQIEAERTIILKLNGGAYPQLETVERDDGAPAPVQDVTSQYLQYVSRYSGAQSAQEKLGKRMRWLQSAMGGSLSRVLKLLKPCPLPCEDAEIAAFNAPHRAQISRLVRQDLVQWRALFDDWKRQRLFIVSAAQPALEAVGAETSTLDSASKSALAHYRAAMLSEVEALLSITKTAVHRTFDIESGRVDAVTGPSRSASARK